MISNYRGVGLSSRVSRAIVISALGAWQTAAAQTCVPTTPAEKTALSQYVQKKYRLHSSPVIINDEESFGTCYRKVTFSFQNGSSTSKMILYLSPDHCFLTRELWDSQLDPALEQKLLREKLNESLAKGDFPSLGSKDARITITIFSDFQCPYCKQAAEELERDILPQEKDVRLVFRNLPLNIHDWAEQAANYAVCGQAQSNSAFWLIHDFIFEHQADITPANLSEKLEEYSRIVPGLDFEKLHACLSEDLWKTRIQDDKEFAEAEGIRSTPTIFINGQMLHGADVEQIRTIINELKRQWKAGVAGESKETNAARNPDAGLRK